MKLNEFLLLEKKKSSFKVLQDNKVPLTDEERKEVFKRDAVWHPSHANTTDPNTGKKVEKVSAVWKSKKKDGSFVYITHTHRAYQVRPTLKGAINIFHRFIKSTA